MSTLPSNPNLEQLRHQARELLRAAQAGESAAIERIHAVSDRTTLSAAQLAIAREYGLASWPALKAEVEARNQSLAEAVDAFVRFSVNGRLGPAGQLWGQHPEIPGFDIRTAVVLGDVDRVADELSRDPELALRRDPRTGWTPLHLVCASRWHADPARAEGLAAIAAMLLDAGGDLDGRPNPESQWSPLRCAIASTMSGRGNEPIVRLLLERGARVHDHDLYLAGFADGGGQWCLRLLIQHCSDVRAIAEQALAAPISLGDTEAVRVLLNAGAEPRRYRDDDGNPTAVLPAAIAAGCSLELIDLLLVDGADPNAIGKDGRSPYANALARGREDLAELLLRHGASDDSTPLDRLSGACLRGDRTEAMRLLEEQPQLRAELAGADSSLLVLAAERGDEQAIDLLLDVGFPASAGRGVFDPAGVNGATALHAAAWAGSAGVVERLLAAAVSPDILDGHWQSTPLVWALIGSSERRPSNPKPDWVATVRLLLDAGADTTQINLDPSDDHYPSPDVVELLASRGITPSHPAE